VARIDPARSDLRQKRSEQQKILLAHEQNFIFFGQPVELDGGFHAAKSPAEHEHPPRHISPQYLDDAPAEASFRLPAKSIETTKQF
jgi:hypothetical protein